MIRLSKEQMKEKLDFIENYVNAYNAADGSPYDANSNVASKNIATLMAELNKDVFIQVNRTLIKKELEELYGKGENSIAEKYIKQLEAHECLTV